MSKSRRRSKLRELLIRLEDELEDDDESTATERNENTADSAVAAAASGGSSLSAGAGPSSGRMIGSEYRRLFSAYRQMPFSTYGPPSKKRRKLADTPPKSQKLWRHSFVFLQKKTSVIVPDARTRAELFAYGYGEKKLEFEPDGKAAHVHEVICRACPDLARTGYELCVGGTNFASGGRHLDVIEAPRKGFSVGFLRSWLCQAKCYVRPVQEDLEDKEGLSSESGDDVPKAVCSTCNETVPIHRLKAHKQYCLQQSTDTQETRVDKGFGQEDHSTESEDEELQEVLALSRISCVPKVGECSSNNKPMTDAHPTFHDLEEVVKLLHQRLDTGKKSLLLVKRTRILEDTMHNLTKESFSPTSGITVKFIGEQGVDGGGPTREFFRLLRDATKEWFHGVDGSLLPICSASAIQDRRFIKLGWIISLSLAMNGCAFAYFAKSVYESIAANCLEDVKMEENELPFERRALVQKVEQASTKQELIRVFESDSAALNLLYDSAKFRKPLNLLDMDDKESIVVELRDGLLYSCWAAICHIKEGLGNLGLLKIIRENRQLMKQFFCYEPPIVCSALLQSLYQVDEFSSNETIREKEEDAYSHFVRFIDESDAEGCCNILIFTCGCDQIPPGGLKPSPTVSFYDGAYPLASTCSNEIVLPTEHDTYYEFKKAMDDAMELSNVEGFSLP